MKINRALSPMFMVFLLIAYTNCSQGFKAAAFSDMTSGLGVSPLPDPSDINSNVIPVQVGGGSCGYPNAPCISVTICMPGTNQCKTIPNILLDTGSTGLRVFKQLLTDFPLSRIKDPTGRDYGQCLSYLGGSSNWGPIARADIQLGREKASNVPMQIIDDKFSSPPADCKNLDADPNVAGFNGILGLGLFVEDCGEPCVEDAAIKMYYACLSGSCEATKMPIANQVANPVAKLAMNNNGILLKFPSVAGFAAGSLTGTLILGIGTKSNNTLPGVTVLKADAYGNFKTEFDGKTFSNAFIDSGSNALFFPATNGLTKCSDSGNAPGFFCPSSTQSFQATMKSATGSASQLVSFQVANAESLSASSSNMVFPALAGDIEDNFDWGLPFFFGRSVYIAIEGKSSNLGTGPYWAF